MPTSFFIGTMPSSIIAITDSMPESISAITNHNLAPEAAQSLKTRGRMGSVTGVQIASTGFYVPERTVTNEDLAALGCDSEWIIRRTGIRERRRAAPDQATSDLAYQASLECMQKAGVTASEIDLILVATVTPDHRIPSTACHLQRMLGATCPAMDLSAACAGFVYALLTGSQFISAGNARCVLVVGADLMTQTVDPSDVKTFPLFGDGAGAAIITADDTTADDGDAEQQAGILAYQLGSEGEGADMLCIPGGGSRQPFTSDNLAGSQYMTMDGRSVFKWAVRVFSESATEVLAHCGVAPSDLSLVVMHQANQRIIDAAVADLGVDSKKVFVNLDRYGNTSAASIPLALAEAASEGRIQKGDYVLLSGFGAGLAWGTAVLRW